MRNISKKAFGLVSQIDADVDTGRNTICCNVSGFTTSGGFKFAAASTDSSKPSPFSLAPTTSTSTAPPPSGGFKFGASATTAPSTGGLAAVSKEDTPKVSPFTFGAQSANNNKVSDKSDASAAPPGGGFKFGAPSSTSSEKSSESAAQQQQPTAGGFKFNGGSNDSSSAANEPEVAPAPPPSGGFKFGVQETSEAGLKQSSNAGVGGFSFGQKTDSGTTKPAAGGATGSAAPLSGGFTFGGAGGSSTATTTTIATGTTGKSAAAKTEPKVEFKPGTCLVRLRFVYRLKMFTRNVKKIKGAAHKNGDVDGTCKRGLKQSKSVGFVHDLGMPLALVGPWVPDSTSGAA